ERIVEEIGARIGPAAAEAEAALRAMDASAAAARQAYLELLFKLLDRFVEVLSSDESAAWARIIVREQQEPSPAFDLLYDRLQGRLLAQLAALVARVRGHATPTANDRVIVLTIIGQALIFRVARATALRFTGWGRLDARQTARIKNVLRRTVAASLTEAGRDAYADCRRGAGAGGRCCRILVAGRAARRRRAVDALRQRRYPRGQARIPRRRAARRDVFRGGRPCRGGRVARGARRQAVPRSAARRESACRDRRGTADARASGQPARGDRAGRGERRRSARRAA